MTQPVTLRWFLPMDVDVAHLGTWPPEGAAPTVDHLVDITRAAEDAGFTGLLVPTSYVNPLDNLVTAPAVLARTGTAALLLAIRPNQYHPAQAARLVASLETLFPGRIELNVTTGGWDEDRWIGNDDDRGQRLERLAEWLEILEAVLYGDTPVRYRGRYYWTDGARLREPLPRRVPLAMSGSSPAARELLAKYGNEYLMFAGPEEAVRAEIAALRAGPGGAGVDVVVRAHLIVRETEEQARAAAEELLSRVDPRVRAMTGASRNDPGSQRAAQDELARSKDLYLTRHLWAGVGTARYGAAVAVVGDPEQVADVLAGYVAAGVRGFILSGYPKLAECHRFGALMTPVLRSRGLLAPLG
jgi:alkanesulfonate monooxygenase